MAERKAERHALMSRQLTQRALFPELWQMILEMAIDRPATIINRFIKRMLHDLTFMVGSPPMWTVPRRMRFIQYQQRMRRYVSDVIT